VGACLILFQLFKTLKIDTSNYSSGTLYQSIGLDYKGSEHNALDDATSVALTLEALFKFNSEVNESSRHQKLRKGKALGRQKLIFISLYQEFSLISSFFSRLFCLLVVM